MFLMCASVTGTSLFVARNRGERKEALGIALALSRLSLGKTLGEERLGFIEFGTPGGAEIVTGTVDVKREHAHAGARALGGDSPGGQCAGDGGGAFVKKAGGRMGGVCGDRGAPFPFCFPFLFLSGHFL